MHSRLLPATSLLGSSHIDLRSCSAFQNPRHFSATVSLGDGYKKKFIDPEGVVRDTSNTVQEQRVEEHTANDADSEPATSTPAQTKSPWAKLLVAGSAVAALGGKAKYLFVVLKLAKLPALLSLLASTAAYSFVFGWPMAVGMMGLILVHESGHALAMHYYRIPFSPMVFIPFMGASVAMTESPPDAHTNAMIALAGPVLGGLAAIACGGLGLAFNSQLLLALGQFGVMINLFNLLPIGMLDGGQIASSLSKWFLLAGWFAGAGLLLAMPYVSPIFYLVMIMSTWTTYSRFRNPPQDPSFYRISPTQRAGIFLGYLACLGVLLVAAATIKQQLLSPQQLRAQQDDNQPRSEFEQRLMGLSELDEDEEEEWRWAAEQDDKDRGRWR